MSKASYHHSQRTRFSVAEAAEAIGKRARITLEGRIVEVRNMDAGACVVFAVDERFGFGDTKLGGDLELFDVEEDE